MDRYTQNMMMTSGKFAEEREYWLQQLAGDWVMSGFPTDFLRESSRLYERAGYKSRLSDVTFQNLCRISNGSSLALYMNLLMGVTYLLHRYTGSGEITVGMPRLKQTGGSSLPQSFFTLRTAVTRNESARELLLRVRDVVSQARKYANISYPMIREFLQVPVEENLPLFHTLVLLKDLHAEEEVADLDADLVFTFAAVQEGIEVEIDYNAKLYEVETIRQIDQHLQRFLAIVTDDMERKLSGLDILLPEERDEIVYGFNRTAREYPRDKTLHEMFVEQAKRTPDHLAVIAEEQTLTYRVLDERSNRVARYLQEVGVATQELVGVIAKRTPNTLVNILGILKAGAVYVPIDPDHPEDRRTHIRNHSQCKLILEPDQYERESLSRLSGDDLKEQYDANSLAYVLYTSGSTGLPKGVAITHYNALNTVYHVAQKFQVNEQDRVIGISSFCFDLSVFDIFGTFCTGAALVIVPNQRDIPKIAEMVNTYQITVWNSVPAILNLVASTVSDTYQNTSLRLVMLSGDWIPLKLFSKMKQRFLNAQMMSLGGPTETSIWSIYYPVREVKPEWSSIPYGMPLPNQHIYILDEELQLCPYGVEGELCFGGDGVGAGYYRDDEKTQKTFIQHPEFGRLYKTGDFGVLKREGYIKLHGRKDFQVKIRGYRIEIGEIQALLLKYPGVTQTVVAARGDSDENRYLCAYIVSNDAFTIEEVRGHLAKKLPDYMVPSRFVRLDKLPLSTNGKVDLNALPDPDGSLQTGTLYEKPRDEIEAKLVAVWQEILGFTKIGIHDNFFSMGGDSIKALKAISQISHEFTVEIKDIFEKQTVAELSAHIHSQQDAGSAYGQAQGTRSTSLLRFQDDGSRAPFFLIHPVSGFAFCYMELARELGDQPFYGLQARGIEPGEQPFTSIPEMATYYLDIIRTVQPQGPYLIGGWSLGGVVAYELAKQLKQQGEEIALLALLDSSVPTLTQQPEGDRSKALDFAADLVGQLGIDISDEDHPIKQMNTEEILHYVYEQAQGQGILPVSFGMSDLNRYFDVFKANVAAYQGYVPTGSLERLSLVRAVDGVEENGNDESLGWSERVKDVAIYQVPGNHYSMVQAPSVQVLAKQINNLLEIAHEQCLSYARR